MEDKYILTFSFVLTIFVLFVSPNHSAYPLLIIWIVLGIITPLLTIYLSDKTLSKIFGIVSVLIYLLLMTSLYYVISHCPINPQSPPQPQPHHY